MAKHTPGPWHVHTMKSKAGFRIDSAGDEWQWLAEVFQAPDKESEGEANARLIAAAPEMLEALKDITQWAQGYHDAYSCSNAGSKCIICLAEKAIAKAEGK